MERAIIIVTMALTVAGLGHCNKARAVDNIINIDQVGNNNQTSIVQNGWGNSATVTTGQTTSADNTYIAILQQGTGAKTASVDIPSGINNGINIIQDGVGNHTASIQKLNGSGNQISITQQGDGNHEFNVVNGAGTTNNGNTVNGTQSGGIGENKLFNLFLNGATGATANVTQSGAANAGSMTIQCMPGTCGTWSYTRQ